jgi:hypothetical protein
MSKPRKISRVVAKRRGLTRYFTGKPCGRGHVAERQTSNRMCMECGDIIALRYNKSPKGRESSWLYRQSPKGRQSRRCFRQSPNYREYQWQWSRTPKGREKRRRYDQSTKGLVIHREWARRDRLTRRQAEYDASPTQANWTRLSNLIARRMRDGR